MRGGTYDGKLANIKKHFSPFELNDATNVQAIINVAVAMPNAVMGGPLAGVLVRLEQSARDRRARRLRLSRIVPRVTAPTANQIRAARAQQQGPRGGGNNETTRVTPSTAQRVDVVVSTWRGAVEHVGGGGGNGGNGGNGGGGGRLGNGGSGGGGRRARLLKS